MIVRCKNCATRFHLSDDRIPPGGAKVRCSRCKHSFHLNPLSPEMDQKPAVSTGTQDTVQGTPEEPRKVKENLDLDSEPESFETGAEASWLGGGDSRGGGASESVQGTWLGGGDSSSEETEATPGDAPEEKTSASDDPDLENPEFLFEFEDSGSHTPAQGADPEQGGASAGGSSGAASKTSGTSAEEPAAVELELAAPEAAASQQDATEDSDDPLAEWDPFSPEESSEIANSVEPFGQVDLQPGTSGGESPVGENLDGVDSRSDPLTGEGERTVPGSPVPAQTAGSGRSKARAARAKPAPPVPTAPRIRRTPIWNGTAVASLAVLLGAMMIAGGLRVMWLQAMRPPPGPAEIHGAGWVASGVRAMQLRDALGRPVLVLRGRLRQEGSSVAPEVRAILLDVAGKPVAAPVTATLDDGDPGDFSPEGLAERLLVPRRRLGSGTPSAFTVLIPNPPDTTRRFRVELH